MLVHQRVDDLKTINAWNQQPVSKLGILGTGQRRHRNFPLKLTFIGNIPLPSLITVGYRRLSKTVGQPGTGFRREGRTEQPWGLSTPETYTPKTNMKPNFHAISINFRQKIIFQPPSLGFFFVFQQATTPVLGPVGDPVPLPNLAQSWLSSGRIPALGEDSHKKTYSIVWFLSSTKPVPKSRCLFQYYVMV